MAFLMVKRVMNVPNTSLAIDAIMAKNVNAKGVTL
jgi:hypothetical protein